MYLVFSCDEWKSFSSCKPIGAFTTEKYLKPAICKLFREDQCVFSGEDIKSAKKGKKVNQIINEIKSKNVYEINDALKYVLIIEMKENTLSI